MKFLKLFSIMRFVSYW